MQDTNERKSHVGELTIRITFDEDVPAKLREIAKTANRLADQIAELQLTPKVKALTS